MSSFLNILKKELREMLSVSTLVTMVVTLLLFMSLGAFMSSETEKQMAPSKILVFDCDGSAGDDPDIPGEGYAVEQLYKAHSHLYGEGHFDKYVMIITSTTIVDTDTVRQEMTQMGYSDALVIEPGFFGNIHSSTVVQGSVQIYSEFVPSGIMGGMMSSVLITLMQTMSNNIAKELANQGAMGEDLIHPVDYGKRLTIVNGEVAEGVTPADIQSALTGMNMILPMITMLVITLIGGIVISSMGNEKENKTLETLLTMPVKRMTIVCAKLLAAALVGLLIGLGYLIGLMFYSSGMNGMSLSTVDLESIGLALSITDWLLVGCMLFLSITCALGICMIIGAFVKNYKSAQTMTLPLSGLALVPMMMIMFMGWDPIPEFIKVVLFIIPFTHPMMSVNNLMFDNHVLLFSGLLYLLAFSALVIGLAVRIYRSDLLVTGIGQTRVLVRLRALLGGRRGPE